MNSPKASRAISADANTVYDTPVEQLLLDVKNPRLSSGAGGDTQEDLLKVLWNEMAVDEVAFSIAANGFFKEEPLLVITSDEVKGEAGNSLS